MIECVKKAGDRTHYKPLSLHGYNFLFHLASTGFCFFSIKHNFKVTGYDTIFRYAFYSSLHCAYSGSIGLFVGLVVPRFRHKKDNCNNFVTGCI